MPSLLPGMETVVVGALLSSQSGKVKRWALNAIAQLGREKPCRDAVAYALAKFGEDPEIAAAAVAALFHISKNAQEELRKSNSIDKDVVVLAALQRVPASKLDMSETTVCVDDAASEILKLALVVVGMDKAPANLFDPRHDNAAIVKALGKHHDPIVSQYSVWAITENPRLNLSALGIDLRDVERQPANVRSWVYQLVAMDKRAADHFEYIRLGSEDTDPEARRGVTMGLRETYFDGLDELISPWFFSEDDTEVRDNLIEHIVRQASRSAGYESTALEVFRTEPEHSKARQRMEAAAATTPLYAKFRRIALTEADTLFSAIQAAEGGPRTVTNNTYNIGQVTGNAAFGGDATNSGSLSVNQAGQRVELILGRLDMAEALVKASAVPQEVKDGLSAAVADAKASKSKGAFKSLFEWLGKAKKALALAAGVAGDISDIGGLADDVGGLLDLL